MEMYVGDVVRLKSPAGVVKQGSIGTVVARDFDGHVQIMFDGSSRALRISCSEVEKED